MDTHGKDSQKRGGGPKTQAGKRRSAKNATKHGFFVARVLPEEEKEARALHPGFVAELQPKGDVELEIIEDMVVNRLQKKRLDRNDAYEFNLARRNHENERVKLRETRDSDGLVRIANIFGNPVEVMLASERLPPKLLTGMLRRLRDDVEKAELTGPQIRATLQLIYGTDFSSAAGRLLCLCAAVEERVERDSQGTLRSPVINDADRAEMLATIDGEIEGQISEEKRQIELDAVDFSRNTPIVPSEIVLEKHSRYRSASQREFTQLLKQFRTLRKLKNGD